MAGVWNLAEEKDFFVKELDQALADGRIDLAVHSLKDMPMEESSEFPILAYSRREDPRDVLIYKSEKKEQGTEEGSILTKTGAVIGTSSKRRMIQIQKLYPNAVFQGIRGNIQTRLSKLNKEEYDAAVLAAAGVKRLNMEAVIGRYFSVDEVIPAAGQGILAVQGRKEFLKDTVWRQYVDDKKSRVQALAERSFIRVLDGGCTSPSAAYAKVKGNELELTGLYYNEKSGQYFVKKAASYIEDASSLGERLALTMKKAVWGKVRKMEQSLYGKVWIAGAGPGDAGLLTLRTAELIEEADVIVYDALLSAEILSRIPRETETIYVGKHAGNHPVPQEEINQILVREAKKGKRVLRLKGGDPFVFGRGGEEIEILRNEKISFEIIPGITSSVAVPAYAGIPVTHRDYTSSFHVITGHTRRDVKPDIDYEALVKLNATLIFLMGVSAMETILTELIKAGMPEDMPAAVIERGNDCETKAGVCDCKNIKAAGR